MENPKDRFRPKQSIAMTLLKPRQSNIEVEKWFGIYVDDYSKKDIDRYRDKISHFITKGGDKIKRASHVNEKCIECGKPNANHGWIGNLFTGEKICPGDYIIKYNGIVTKLTPKAFEILFGDTDNITEEKIDKTGQMSLL